MKCERPIGRCARHEFSCRAVVHPRSRHRRQGPIGARSPRRHRHHRPAGRSTRIPPGLVRRAPQHELDRSSATSVLIAHVAAHTSTIRLGAGGIMLPNHAPLLIAEQFGTLETLHPGRIDLGLGRAPGSDQATMRAMRRDPMSSDSFPQDVLELQGFLTGGPASPGSTPRRARAPTCRSTSSARRCSAPSSPRPSACRTRSHRTSRRAALQHAVATYRREFQPSEQLAEPYVIAGVNVIAADTDRRGHRTATRRQSVPCRALPRRRPGLHRR